VNGVNEEDDEMFGH